MRRESAAAGAIIALAGMGCQLWGSSGGLALAAASRVKMRDWLIAALLIAAHHHGRSSFWYLPAYAICPSSVSLAK